jgi:hypothetical protein
MKLLYSEEVRAGKSALSGLRLGNMRASAPQFQRPPGRLDLVSDKFAHLPVEVDERRVDELQGPLAGGGNEAGDFCKNRHRQA